MSDEKWKWHTVTIYVDMETGECISKLQIGVSYYKVKELNKTIKKNHKDYEHTITRTIGCKRTSGIQQTIWNTIS